MAEGSPSYEAGVEYWSSDSDRYSQRVLEVIGDRQELRDRMRELPWVSFEPVPDVSLPPTQTQTSSDEFFEKLFLEGLERDLAPDQLCRVLYIFNEVRSVVAAAGRLDAEASRSFYVRFEEVIGDDRDLLARALVYLGSRCFPRTAENVEIPIPDGLRNMFFIAKFSLILVRDIKSELNLVDFYRCMSIWERYQRYGFNSRYYEVASRKIFEEIKKVLRPHKRLMRIIRAAPWPHWNRSSGQASPSPDQNRRIKCTKM